MTDANSPRQTTEIDRIADAYFDAQVALSPLEATYLGVPGHDEEIDDLSATRLARDIVKKIEESLTYPGQIKVTVIRETRAVDYAK